MNKKWNELIQDLIDGVMSPEDFERLQDAMVADPELRHLYYQYISMQQNLEFRLAKSTVNSGVVGLAESRLKRQRKRSYRIAALAAAAAVAMTFFVLSLVLGPNAERNLAFSSSPGSKYELTHVASDDQSLASLKPGSRLKLLQGAVELNFGSGVRSVIEAPADITLHDYDKLFMDTGRGWFHVPAGAEGFTVKTREFEVVDLGTKFGVLASPKDPDQVHVMKGKVAVTAKYGEMHACELVENMAVEVRASGRYTPVTVAPERFSTELPKTLPHLHFAFDDGQQLLASNTLKDAGDFSYQGSAGSEDLSIVDGPFAGALQFDQNCEFIETNWEGVLNDNPRTVAMWVKMPQTRLEPGRKGGLRDAYLVAWGRQNLGKMMNFNQKWTVHLDFQAQRSPILNMSFGGFWYYTRDIVVDDDQWHHIAVVHSGQYDDEGLPKVALYFDGQQVEIFSDRHGPTRLDEKGKVELGTYAEAPMVIGKSLYPFRNTKPENSDRLEAALDELYIIEGALDAEAVQQLYQENRLIGL
ncbi:LamG-like jellyroll fold domain-containing protein [Rubritalea tangerina]|uniref:LamG-like jellyroll fold domain-containing protein n=2 Tax=Rubritalea tangerina TaxID=430798 RepID=A0ABW4ZBW4_9BACT